MAGVEKSGTGLTRTDWVAVNDRLPARAEAVLIAYRFQDDDSLTVDIGELDRNGWKYIGGGPIVMHGEVLFWAELPAAPALPQALNEAA